jgi:probable selenium-dependent hydroxylase accessory protein YqeC
VTSTSLLQVLALGRGDVVAVAGAGGKTTLVYRLADEARAAGWRVLVTTTTHMGTLPEATTGPVILEEEGELGTRVGKVMRETGYATVLGRRVRPDKIEGLGAPRVDDLVSRADLVLVEADGARGRSLKVPAPHEPVIPRSTTFLLVVAALDALGQPLDEARVHRLELVAAATGLKAGETLDEQAVATALTHPAGYPARIARGLRAGVFLNKAEDAAGWAAAERIAPRLLGPYSVVAAGSARGGDVRVWR